MKSPSDLLQWPAVPMDQRPKPVYHVGLVDSDTATKLIDLGWKPVDIRLMESRTDDDRRVALKAFLEGLRFGTIEMDPKMAKWVELEAKVYEIHKGVVEKPKSDISNDSQNIESVLQSFGSDKPFSTPPEARKTKKMRGRKASDVKKGPPSEED